MYIQCTIEQPPKGILPLDQDFIYLVAGFSNLAGARRKSPATSSICAGYFSFSKFYCSNYAIGFQESNRDLIFLRK